MGWARLDDGFHDHPKVDGLSLAAVGLYTLCLTWAHRHRRTAVLPGHLTEARVRKFAGNLGQKLAAEVVHAGLWEVEPNLGGYVIHDFSDYLPKERDPSERKEAGRKGAAKRWETDSKLPSESMASDSSCASAPAFPSRPVPSQPEEQTQDLAPQSPQAAPRTRGTRLPADFTLPSEWARWAVDEGHSGEQVRRIAEKFIDHWLAAPGARGVKLDWAATWRNWVRNEPTARHQTGPKQSTTDQRVAEGYALAAKFAAMESGATP